MRTIEVITVPKIKTGKTITFSIVACKHQQHIGYVTLKGLSEKTSHAELGIAIMDGLYRSQGYGSQALKHARNYAFEKLNLSEIILTVFPSNITAIRAYKKVGFQQIRCLKKHWIMPNGQKADLLLMRLLRQN